MKKVVCYAITWIIVYLFSVPLLFNTALAQIRYDSTQIFNQGIHAFRNKEYSKALNFFVLAEQNGMKNSRLDYNMGATHYKLGNYMQAYNSLERATTDSELKSSAHLNMGLSAVRLQKTNLAKQQFRLAYQHAKSTKEKKLVYYIINQVGLNTSLPKNKWIGSINTIFGYNDNVTLAEQTGFDNVSGENTKGDGFFATHLKIGGQLNRFEILFSPYLLKYNDSSDFDFGKIAMDLNYKNNRVKQQLTLGGHFEYNYLAGRNFQAISQINFEYQKIIGNVGIGIQSRFSHFNVVPAYYYLSGNQHQTRLISKYKLANTQFMFGYALENNWRRDINSTQPGIKSQSQVLQDYSPTRHSLIVSGSRPFGSKMHTDLQFQYRISTFQKSENNHTDERWQFISRMNYDIANTVATFMEYAYSINQSTDPSFKYQNNFISVGVIYKYF